MRVDKRGASEERLDVVARELRLGDVDFGLDHVLHPEGQVGHGDLFFYTVIDAVNALVLVAGEVQYGLAQGFGGNGAGVDANSADTRAFRPPRLFCPA